jgi:hypothetical protein
MRSPDRTDIERIEGLLRGMPPESEREARLEGLIRELRGARPAPSELRERVRALRPEVRKPSRRRTALILVPVALVFAAAVIGIAQLRSGSGDSREAGGGGAVDVARPLPTAPSSESVGGQGQEDSATELGALAPDTARAQEWDVQLELRVPNNDRLGDASADAIRTTRELGGIVVSSSVSTRGRSGEAQLVVRVPSRRIQDAIARFSALGTITAQNVSIQDRQDDLDRLARRIDALRVQIAQLNLRLRTEQLSEPERLRLELRRERLTAQVNGATAQRRGVQREVDLAEVSLTIRTGDPVAAPAEGRVEGAARDALHVLSIAGAVALFLLIVLSPLVGLGVLLLLARRAYRRRETDRLLEQPRPAASRE